MEEGDESETQDIDALLPAWPMYAEEDGRPNLAKDGEEEMRCKL